MHPSTQGYDNPATIWAKLYSVVQQIVEDLAQLGAVSPHEELVIATIE